MDYDSWRLKMTTLQTGAEGQYSWCCVGEIFISISTFALLKPTVCSITCYHRAQLPQSIVTIEHSVTMIQSIVLPWQYSVTMVVQSSPDLPSPDLPFLPIYCASFCSPKYRVYKQIKKSCKSYPDLPCIPIYRAFYLSPEMHGKSGDDCISAL